MALQHIVLVAAGLLGASAVGLGAFGAHALKTTLTAAQASLWVTASQYHLVHAAALVALAALMGPLGSQGRHTAAALICAGGLTLGTVLFSGSLYALALGAPRGVGMITPVGGLLFMVGWLSFAMLGYLAR